MLADLREGAVVINLSDPNVLDASSTKRLVSSGSISGLAMASTADLAWSETWLRESTNTIFVPPNMMRSSIDGWDDTLVRLRQSAAFVLGTFFQKSTDKGDTEHLEDTSDFELHFPGKEQNSKSQVRSAYVIVFEANKKARAIEAFVIIITRLDLLIPIRQKNGQDILEIQTVVQIIIELRMSWSITVILYASFVTFEFDFSFSEFPEDDTMDSPFVPGMVVTLQIMENRTEGRPSRDNDELSNKRKIDASRPFRDKSVKLLSVRRSVSSGDWYIAKSSKTNRWDPSAHFVIDSVQNSTSSKRSPATRVALRSVVAGGRLLVPKCKESKPVKWLERLEHIFRSFYFFKKKLCPYPCCITDNIQDKTCDLGIGALVEKNAGHSWWTVAESRWRKNQIAIALRTGKIENSIFVLHFILDVISYPDEKGICRLQNI